MCESVCLECVGVISEHLLTSRQLVKLVTLHVSEGPDRDSVCVCVCVCA